MNRSSTAALCALLLAFPAALSAAPALARASNGYLSWTGKTAPPAPAPAPAPVQQVHTTSGDYAVPASPYGQVGDPLAPSMRTLRWPAKPGAQPVQPQAPRQPRQPAQAPAYTYEVAPQADQASSAQTHAPVPQPATVYSPVPPAFTPQPLPLARTNAEAQYQDRPDPGAADDAGGANERPPERTIARNIERAATDVHPSAQAQNTSPQDEGDYHVPASSPYAARIAAARQAQADARVAQIQAQAGAQANAASQAEHAPAPSKSAKAKKTMPVATAPAPSLPLAVAEADHVFVPGQHYTSAADEPRIYSLHRQYGLTPDPITLDPHPTGALLGDPITRDEDADASDTETTDEDSDDTARAAAARASASPSQKH